MESLKLTLPELKQYAQYDPQTGAVSYTEHRLNPKRLRGKAVTQYVPSEGLRFRLPDSTVAAHRLAWVLYSGYWPVGRVMHLNGDKRDNRAVNLALTRAGDGHRKATLHREYDSRGREKMWVVRIYRWDAEYNVNRLEHTGKYDNETTAEEEYEIACGENPPPPRTVLADLPPSPPWM